ncbi:MAG TPA: hypothetical protein VFO73_05270 [Candidatus Limnocylindrales bacterium]|nr:hypothetical protein [Candidatus Limnocylindrales bacterium]
MDDVVWIVAILAGLRALLALLAHAFDDTGPPGWPLGEGSREAFWRRSLPWPHGVQEDDEIAWHVPRPAPPPGQERLARAETLRRVLSGERPVPPTRPQSRIVGR